MLKEILEGKDKSKEFNKLQKLIKSMKNSLDSFEEEFRIISTTPQGTNGEWIDEKENMIDAQWKFAQKQMSKISDTAYNIL